MKNDIIFDRIFNKDGKCIFKLNDKSGFQGLNIRLTGIEYDEKTLMPMFNYEITRLPKKYNLDDKKVHKKFEKVIEKLFNQLIEESKKEEVVNSEK